MKQENQTNPIEPESTHKTKCWKKVFRYFYNSTRKQHRLFSSFYLCHLIVSILQSLLCLFRLRFVCSFFDVLANAQLFLSSSISLAVPLSLDLPFDTLANRMAAFKVSTSNLSNSMIILIKSNKSTNDTCVL